MRAKLDHARPRAHSPHIPGRCRRSGGQRALALSSGRGRPRSRERTCLHSVMPTKVGIQTRSCESGSRINPRVNPRVKLGDGDGDGEGARMTVKHAPVSESWIPGSGCARPGNVEAAGRHFVTSPDAPLFHFPGRRRRSGGQRSCVGFTSRAREAVSSLSPAPLNPAPSQCISLPDAGVAQW